MSKEDFGVLSKWGPLGRSEVSEKVIDFRRAGGKKPRVLRGMRRISTGSGVLGIRTHDSCLYEVVSCDDGGRQDRLSGAHRSAANGSVSFIRDFDLDTVLADQSGHTQ